MKNVILKNMTVIIGTLIGALAGYLYWKFIGCTTGSCPITSSPINSSIYIAVVGALIGAMFKRKS